MKQVISIIVSFLSIVQIYGQFIYTSLESLLQERITYCLTDTINFISKEIFEYNSDHQNIKKDIITKRRGFFERYKYYYNDLGKIISEDYYSNLFSNYKNSLILVSTTKYLYDTDNKLIGNIIKQRIINKEESWETIRKDSCYKNLTDYTIKKDGNNELFYYKNGPLFKKIEYQDSVIVTESYYRINKLESRILYSYKDRKLTKKYTEYYEILDPDRKERLLEMYRRDIQRADSIGNKKAFEKLSASYEELINNDESFKMGNFESEEYFYKKDLLIEERIINKGIDPCFYPCCGNYLIKYKYLE